MEEINTPQVLPAVGLFAELDESIRERLSKAGRFETAKRNDYLALQGMPHKRLAIIVSGTASVNIHAHGDTVHVADIGPGDTVGEMSVLDSHQASANVEVREPMELWSISRDDFNAFVDRNPAEGLKVVKIIARELCQRLRRASDRLLRNADEMRSHFLDMDY